MELLSSDISAMNEKPPNLSLEIPVFTNSPFNLSHDIGLLSGCSSPWGTPLEGGCCERSPSERPLVPTSSADWEARKDIIGELYMTQNLILNDVMKIMQSRHKFKATARMYKGQFAKWKWSKYNKSGSSNSSTTGNPISRTKSRSATRRRGSSLPSKATSPMPQNTLIDVAVEHHQQRDDRFTQGGDLGVGLNLELGSSSQVLFANSDAHDMEETLSAYAAYISSWSQLETPWKPPSGRQTSSSWASFSCLAYPPSSSLDQHSILQNVRLALDHFSNHRPASGGDVLRRAFLQVELAITDATRDVEAIWDCCLAVPQLVLTTGWTDILVIFTHFLHRLTAIKLPGHPIATVASNLFRLSRKTHDLLKQEPYNSNRRPSIHLPSDIHTPIDIDDLLPSTPSSSSTTTTTSSSSDTATASPTAATARTPLEFYILSAWRLWIDLVTTHRGRTDPATIHLKRGYIILQSPEYPILRTLIADFRVSVTESLSRRGAAKTTSRILELERLLSRMYLPLFTEATTRRADGLLTGLLARIQHPPAGGEEGGGEWGYAERCMVFSACHFLAALADFNGEEEKAEGFRKRSMEGPRDLFWLQTAETLEGYLRGMGRLEEAEKIKRERAEVKARSLEEGEEVDEVDGEMAGS